MAVSPALGLPERNTHATSASGARASVPSDRRASVTQWAPCGTGPVRKKARIVSQPTIKEELEEEVMGEAMVTGEVEAVGKLVVEVVADEDATMRDAPEAAPMAEAGLLVDAMRMLPMDAVEALLGIRSNGTIRGYLQTSLAETAWQTLQETRKLCESSERQEKLEQMIVCRLDSLVGQGRVQNVMSMRGKGKQRAEENDSDSEEQLV